ncbi:50S ribosomal protein L4 [Verrucomicrobiota bacterium]
MSKLTVYDMQGASVGDVEIPDSALVLKGGEQAVHDSVVAHRAACRAGTASTLSKGEVAGSNKKPWRQKGLGRARAGYRQSPVWRGGGVAFGPKPRRFGIKLNRKVSRLAFRRSVSDKISRGEIRLVDSLAFQEPKTKLMAAFMKSLELSRPTLLVLGEPNRNVSLAVRNLPSVEVVRASDLCTYQVLRYPVLVVDRAGMTVLQQRLGVAEQDSGVPAGEGGTE